MEVLLAKQINGSLRPADGAAWDKLRQIPAGTTMVVDIKDPRRRSGQQHRFWFALAHLLFENQSNYAEFEEFRARLLVYLGYYEPVKTATGETIAMPKSLRFGKMPADEFTALVDATLNFAASLGWDKDELLAQTKEAVAA